MGKQVCTRCCYERKTFAETLCRNYGIPQEGKELEILNYSRKTVHMSSETVGAGPVSI